MTILLLLKDYRKNNLEDFLKEYKNGTGIGMKVKKRILL